MTTSPSSRTALVTGASTGIGRATAVALAARGITVYGTARTPDAVEWPADVHPLQLDVTDEQSMTRASARLLRDHERIDILVNNAGYGLNGFLEDLPIAAVRAQFETNVFGLLRMTQLLTPAMRAAGRGRLIHVGSIGGVISAPGAGAYHASKFALEAIADVQRMELRRFGISVTLIQPTGVHTPFFDKIASTYPGTTQTSPYWETMARHRDVTRRMYDHGPGFLLIEPDRVARVIVREALRRRPRSRVKVGASAVVLGATRRLLPDRFWDRAALSQFA